MMSKELQKKFQKRFDLQDQLETERSDYISNNKDLSLLKINNPIAYRREYKRQRKARAKIRKDISHTKRALNELKD